MFVIGFALFSFLIEFIGKTLVNKDYVLLEMIFN